MTPLYFGDRLTNLVLATVLAHPAKAFSQREQRQKVG